MSAPPADPAPLPQPAPLADRRAPGAYLLAAVALLLGGLGLVAWVTQRAGTSLVTIPLAECDLQVLLWFAAAGLLIAGGALLDAWRRPISTVPAQPVTRLEIALFAGLMVAAVFARTLALEAHPAQVHNDEMSSSLKGRDYDPASAFPSPVVTTGPDGQRRVPPPFGSSDWYRLPNICFWLVGVPQRALGQDLLATRLGGVAAGLLALVATYLLTRRLFGPRVALFALAFSVAFHFHVHFSRVATPYMQAAAISLWTLAAFAEGVYTRRLAWRIAAGVGLALCLLTYFSARLTPVILLAWAGALLLCWPALRRTAAATLVLSALAAGALLAPALRHWAAAPELFNARARGVYVLAEENFAHVNHALANAHRAGPGSLAWGTGIHDYALWGALAAAGLGVVLVVVGLRWRARRGPVLSAGVGAVFVALLCGLIAWSLPSADEVARAAAPPTASAPSFQAPLEPARLVAVLRQQTVSFVALFATRGETSQQYAFREAFLDPLTLALTIGGAVLCLLRIGRSENLLLLLAVAATVGSAIYLTIDAPFGPRFILLAGLMTIFPAYLCGSAVDVLWRARWAAVRGLAVPVALAGAGAVALSARANTEAYFVRHQGVHSPPSVSGQLVRVAQRQPTVRTVINLCAADLPGPDGSAVPGERVVNHETWVYLAPQVRSFVNLPDAARGAGDSVADVVRELDGATGEVLIAVRPTSPLAPVLGRLLGTARSGLAADPRPGRAVLWWVASPADLAARLRATTQPAN